MATLTNPQRNTLKAAIIANATANAFRTAGDTPGLLGYCNGTTFPGSPVLAWNVNVQPQTSDEAATYTTYDTLTQGKRDSWRIFLLFARNFSKNRIRNWVTDVWGAATAGSVAEAILQGATESATFAQNAIGGTARTTGTVTATDRNYVALLDQDDVNWLVNN